MPVNANLEDIFPISTPTGEQIRYDVARPQTYAVLDSTYGSELVYNIIDADALLVVLSTGFISVDFVGLGDSTINHGFIVPPLERNVVAIPVGVTQLKIKSLDAALASVKAYVHEMGSWYGLGTQANSQQK